MTDEVRVPTAAAGDGRERIPGSDGGVGRGDSENFRGFFLAPVRVVD